MKRSGFVAVVMMAATLCVAQMMPSHPQTSGAAADPHAGMQSPHGAEPSSRVIFGKECGIGNVSSQSAIGLSRSPEGSWLVVTADRRPGPNDDAVARVWRESNWMVDLHDAPGDGTTIHTGQMCFDSKGQLTHLLDRYMDISKCNCMRYTAMTFDGNGAVVKQEQKYVDIKKGTEITLPETAKRFPAVFGYRKVDQLPFYSLVKK